MVYDFWLVALCLLGENDSEKECHSFVPPETHHGTMGLDMGILDVKFYVAMGVAALHRGVLQ